MSDHRAQQVRRQAGPGKQGLKLTRKKPSWAMGQVAKLAWRSSDGARAQRRQADRDGRASAERADLRAGRREEGGGEVQGAQ